ACAVAVLVTAFASYWMNVRLYKATESSLATLRERGFRHVHDLSVLTQNAERRGALVSRVTTDVDQITPFMQSGGLTIIVSTGQVLVASALMLFYSWQLTLLAWACFVPLAFALPRFQRWLSAAYTQVRQRTGDVLAAGSEAVVGAAGIRAYGAEDRTAERPDAAIDANRAAQTRAQRIIATVFPLTEIMAAVAVAGVVLLGVRLGADGD